MDDCKGTGEKRTLEPERCAVRRLILLVFLHLQTVVCVAVGIQWNQLEMVRCQSTLSVSVIVCSRDVIVASPLIGESTGPMRI